MGSRVRGPAWVRLGGTHIAVGSNVSGLWSSGCGSGGLGTLLGPERTPVRVCSWLTISGLCGLTRALVFVVAVVVGWGVVVC